MTEKQIQAAKDALHKKYYGDGCVYWENLIQPWTKEDEILEEELSCRSMINSILIYGGRTDKESYDYKRYLMRYVTGTVYNNYKGLLTEQRVNELIEEQKADFAKAVVRSNVYTDGEGCSYNSCVWADEM
jgi:hypothetical protein